MQNDRAAATAYAVAAAYRDPEVPARHLLTRVEAGRRAARLLEITPGTAGRRITEAVTSGALVVLAADGVRLTVPGAPADAVVWIAPGAIEGAVEVVVGEEQPRATSRRPLTRRPLVISAEDCERLAADIAERWERARTLAEVGEEAIAAALTAAGLPSAEDGDGRGWMITTSGATGDRMVIHREGARITPRRGSTADAERWADRLAVYDRALAEAEFRTVRAGHAVRVPGRTAPAAEAQQPQAGAERPGPAVEDVLDGIAAACRTLTPTGAREEEPPTNRPGLGAELVALVLADLADAADLPAGAAGHLVVAERVRERSRTDRTDAREALRAGFTAACGWHRHVTLDDGAASERVRACVNGLDAAGFVALLGRMVDASANTGERAVAYFRALDVELAARRDRTGVEITADALCWVHTEDGDRRPAMVAELYGPDGGIVFIVGSATGPAQSVAVPGVELADRVQVIDQAAAAAREAEREALGPITGWWSITNRAERELIRVMAEDRDQALALARRRDRTVRAVYRADGLGSVPLREKELTEAELAQWRREQQRRALPRVAVEELGRNDRVVIDAEELPYLVDAVDDLPGGGVRVTYSSGDAVEYAAGVKVSIPG
ncbi:hypothetical protein ABZW10_32865 [Kitasatospora sp. NPDC004723]|uniref:hypothetical protein n=1 Tax=Kitasatospora sp. NPDC004723 TaxID=3154288 RepID=UPI0033B28E58